MGITFETNQTVVELNGCRIEAFPSHHVDTMRGLTDVKFVLLDEATFFTIGQQQEVRDASERYIAKVDPYIIMISTPNRPDDMFAMIREEKPSLYHRIYLNYQVGLNKIYSEEEIREAKGRPPFQENITYNSWAKLATYSLLMILIKRLN